MPTRAACLGCDLHATSGSASRQPVSTVEYSRFALSGPSKVSHILHLMLSYLAALTVCCIVSVCGKSCVGNTYKANCSQRSYVIISQSWLPFTLSFYLPSEASSRVPFFGAGYSRACFCPRAGLFNRSCHNGL